MFQQYKSQTTPPEVSSSASTTQRIIITVNIKDGFVKCYNNNPCNNNGDCYASVKDNSIQYCRYESIYILDCYF